MNHPSLIRRLIAWQALALVIAWLVLASLMTWQALQLGESQLDARLQQFGSVLAEAAGGETAPQALALRLQAIETALLQASGRDVLGAVAQPLYQVWQADGRLLYRSAGVPIEALAPLRPGYVETAFAGQPYRLLTVASSGGAQLVQIAEPMQLRLSSVLPLLWVVLQSQLGVFLWHGLVIWVTVRSGLAPLRQLAQRISQRRAGEVAPVQVDRLYAETAPVVQELNALLAHEAQRLDSERRFLADAAHELRTPLAAVNAQAHLLLTEHEAPARAEAAGALKQGIARVSHLLGQLLTLARAEGSAAPHRPERLDAAGLLRERIALLAALARPRAIELSLQAPDRLEWALDRSGFCSIIDNLVDNAIRYTPAGGRVEVLLQATASGLELSVRDNGRGIAPAQRERVFERFYRVPGSSEQGTGLGLAIVKRIAEREGAALKFVEGLDGCGVGLRLSYPTA
ncbi:MAG: sensor histidine kinase N-terminal domain-containing protein [Burkholderiaceae bacterium]|nr:sensor histidine kinase N-terminal domain-containing protein [Burkholderiaceae bacterium]